MVYVPVHGCEGRARHAHPAQDAEDVVAPWHSERLTGGAAPSAPVPADVHPGEFARPGTQEHTGDRWTDRAERREQQLRMTSAQPVLATKTQRPTVTPAYLSEQRLRGAYYTPNTAALFMANWVLREEGDRIIEPSFGGGIFLKAVAEIAEQLNLTYSLTGVEIDPGAAEAAMASGLIARSQVQIADFLQLRLPTADGVVGNPPYVRLRRLEPPPRSAALRVTEEILGATMEPSGSIWMPFVLHAARSLRRGGRLAFVLPYDLTYVRYARPLWAYLSRNFANVRVLRTHERLFSDILQEVVLLFADGFGGQTSGVTFEAYETVEELTSGRPVISETIPIDAVVEGERAFLSALLSPELRSLLDGRIRAATVRARDLVTFNIGYVTGDKKFFHPDEQTQATYNLPREHLRTVLTSARQIRQSGLYTASLKPEQTSSLYLPQPDSSLNPGELAYIAEGENTGVSQRFKCRVRTPWYIVPGVRTPDVCLSVFTERPVLLINDGEYAASNSLLCGYARNVDAAEIVARWYTSLTLLQCELEVHALGGGVMVLVPGEAGNIRIPRNASLAHLQAVDRALTAGDTESAYRAGDAAVLHAAMGLSDSDIALIRDGAKTLAHWRTSARASTS